MNLDKGEQDLPGGKVRNGWGKVVEIEKGRGDTSEKGRESRGRGLGHKKAVEKVSK